VIFTAKAQRKDLMDIITDKKMDLKSLWWNAMTMNGSVAVWRCPREKSIHFLADLSDSSLKGRIDIQKTERGFVVSPFMNPEGNETLFLKSDILAVGSNDGIWGRVRGEGAMGDGK